MTRYVFHFRDLKDVAHHLQLNHHSASDSSSDIILYDDSVWNRVRHLLGGKGANLARMTNEGVHVPPGFTVTTEACKEFALWQVENPDLPARDFYNVSDIGVQIRKEVLENVCKIVQELPAHTGFGTGDNPVLFSVRSGAAESMPGMMDTLLNVGLNWETINLQFKKIEEDKDDDTPGGEPDDINNDELKDKNKNFILDCYSRLITIYDECIFGGSKEPYEQLIADYQSTNSLEKKDRSSVKKLGWYEICKRSEIIFEQRYHQSFPSDPIYQLLESILAVFRSWNSKRAKVYRKQAKIPEDLGGTAVNIQLMVFGNKSSRSGSGVVFTRDPATGKRVYDNDNGMPSVYGDFLVNSQGEDVVAGIRTPMSIRNLKHFNEAIYSELLSVCAFLESHFKFMQDIEFTIEDDVLYILQTRNGKTTSQASVQILLDLISEGVLKPEEAIKKIKTDDMSVLLHPQFDPKEESKLLPISSGIPASPGSGIGVICFDSSEALKMKELGHKVVLVRSETSAEDVEGMLASEAVVTANGGATSHAAVVCRQFGIPAVCGAAIKVDYQKKMFETLEENSKLIEDGTILAVNGTNGKLYDHMIPQRRPDLGRTSLVNKVIDLVRPFVKLKVACNADSASEIKLAVAHGAEGVGLCRTEHMFFMSGRIHLMQDAILSIPNSTDEAKALLELQNLQSDDFIKMLTVLEGRPMTVRLLDPPLHEFLPNLVSVKLKAIGMGIAGLTEQCTAAKREEQLVEKLIEHNPMLGFRGCRVSMLRPNFCKMQIRALCNAMIETNSKSIIGKW